MKDANVNKYPEKANKRLLHVKSHLDGGYSAKDEIVQKKNGVRLDFV
jgi:hypothetical protein